MKETFKEWKTDNWRTTSMKYNVKTEQDATQRTAENSASYISNHLSLDGVENKLHVGILMRLTCKHIFQLEHLN